MNLKGKTVFITGASRGIGQQIAIACAKEKCNLLLHAREKKNLEKTLSLIDKEDIEVKTFAAELVNMDEVERLIAEVKSCGSAVDIIYNNAAIMTPWIADVWSCPTLDWEKTFATNVFAVVKICNAFIPDMIARGFGRVINVSSGIANEPELAPYSASKAAIDKFTKDISVKLRGTGVLVNTLDPGWLKTDLGGPNADHEVTTVIPGALIPAKQESEELNGQMIRAQEYRDK